MSTPVKEFDTKREGIDAMEFSVKKFDLLGELELTQGVVERKTTIPILSHLLFEAKGNSLSITATDLELSIRTSCDAKSKKDGTCTIPAKKLYDIVRLLPEAASVLQYRVKSQLDGHERVVREDQLARS